MFAALVGVDGPVETDVRTGILRNDGPGVLGRQGGAQRRDPGGVVGPAVIEGLDGFGFETPARVGSRASSLCRFCREGRVA